MKQIYRLGMAVVVVGLAALNGCAPRANSPKPSAVDTTKMQDMGRSKNMGERKGALPGNAMGGGMRPPGGGGMTPPGGMMPPAGGGGMTPPAGGGMAPPMGGGMTPPGGMPR